MSNYSKGEVVLIRYPFSDLSGSKVRPAVIISDFPGQDDSFVVPLTSKTKSLLPGEFNLTNWTEAGLNVPSAVKRGLYTVHESRILQRVGNLSSVDSLNLDASLRRWLRL